jgi:hypothetical protein
MKITRLNFKWDDDHINGSSQSGSSCPCANLISIAPSLVSSSFQMTEGAAPNEEEELREAVALSLEPRPGSSSSQVSDGVASTDEEDLSAAIALSLEPQPGALNELAELRAIIAFSLKPQPTVNIRSRSRTPERVQNVRERSSTPEPVQRVTVRSVSSLTHDTDTRFDIEVILTSTSGH